MTECGSFAGHRYTTSVQRKVLPITHCQVISDGDTCKCSQNYYLIHRTWIAKNSCYARPVYITCLMCSCRASEESLTTNLGGLQISRHRWAVLDKWIHPWQFMNDVPIVISCTDAAVLQCIQCIINCHACLLLQVKQFQRKIIQRRQWHMSTSWGVCDMLQWLIKHWWWWVRHGDGEILTTSRWRWWQEFL